MTTIFDWTEDEPMLVLNQTGEKVRLTDGVSLYFDDLVGAHVKVMRKNKQITCEASLPESTGVMRWSFLLSEQHDHNYAAASTVDLGSPYPPVRNLAALISEFRVGLNGRL